MIVLALMVMFAMLVTAFMVIVSQQRRAAEYTAETLINPRSGTSSVSSIDSAAAMRDDEMFKQAVELLLSGSEKLDSVIGPHSILENLYGAPGAEPFGGTGAGYNLNPDAGELALLSLKDGAEKPYALRPNILAPDTNGTQEYKKYLLDNDGDVRMNPDYTAPDYMTMFLAWNDFRGGTLERIIPSFHRPQLVRYWNTVDDPSGTEFSNELRKYVLRPLPTDHPNFTGSNPAAKLTTPENLLRFLTGGPWDVDNDGNGNADGIWLDIGLAPIHDSSTGLYYKPLVSYYIIDMEGRINVNTISNSEHSGTSGGMGLGPAELYSELLGKDVLTERYGSDGKPGGNSGDIQGDLLKNHGINYGAYTKGGVAADWRGTSPVSFDNMGNLVKGETIPIDEIPYLMNPDNELTGDKPFQSNDLESLVRSVLEMDYGRLPHNFRELLGDPYLPNRPALASPNLRYGLATRGSDIPVAAKYVPMVDTDGNIIYETLRDRVLRLTEGDQPAADQLWDLLPSAIREGRKMNLNRLTLEPGWMSGALLKEKVRFAQEMFYLMQVLFPEQATQSPESLERLAQWSVNLVDFIDPDDVMTPFIFKKSGVPGSIAVFDNAGLTDDLLAGTLTLPSDYTLIWGFEKPEVAITETFAVHDRHVEKRTVDGIDKYSQVEFPQGAFFVELSRQGNEDRDYSSSSLVGQNNVLNLAQRTGNTSEDYYVWRLAIGEATKTLAEHSEWNDGTSDSLKNNALYQLLTPEGGAIRYPNFQQWATGDSVGQYNPDLGIPERFIWFDQNRPTSGPASDIENLRRSFYNWERLSNPESSLQRVELLPDTSLVLAPVTSSEPSMTFGVDPPLTINLSGGVEWANAAIELSSARRGYVPLNISEPLPASLSMDGYPPPGYQMPGSGVAPYDDGILRQCGTIPCYKTICLQRLADPNRPHDPVCNPYLTVDWSMIDLHVINSLDSTNEEGVHENDLLFVSRQWVKSASDSNLWDRTLPEEKLKGMAGLEDNRAAFHTFGRSDYTKPLLHFPWHDAPFMNTGELMLVPASAPGRFGIEYHDNEDDANSFYGIYDWLSQIGRGEDKPRFSYNYEGFTFSTYPNWTDENVAGTPSEMVRLLDFVYVPAKFFAENRRNDGTVDREPGKINLNTVTETGWEALVSGRDGFPGYEEFRDSRKLSVDAPSEFRPFRSPSATNLVPPLSAPGGENALVGTPASATALDLDLIAVEAENPYLALENVMRLSDVTTTRSNVFAVWMTIGYFEVEKFETHSELQNKYGLSHITPEMFEAVYPDGYVLGAEKGLKDGTVRRHRAFYLIDRSSPVSFQRGVKLDGIKKDVIVWETPLD